MAELKPNYAKNGLDEHVQRHLIYFGLATLLYGVLVFCDWRVYSAWPNYATKYFAEKLLGTYLGCICLFGALIFVEVVTNGNLLKRIINDGIAAAIFCLGLFYVIGWIFTYS
ncbi:MAG TPA: hypothetical protein VIY48_07695 [Candidatus Paceibacterota bacterium]